MSNGTYIALQTLTLSSNDSEVVFASIPSSYRDLVVITDVTASGGSIGCRMRLNGDTGTNYFVVAMAGEGSGALFTESVNLNYLYGNGNAALTGNRIIQVFNIIEYSTTNKHKTVLSRSNDNNAVGSWASVARWANTDVVNSVTLFSGSNSFAIGSTFALYGIQG